MRQLYRNSLRAAAVRSLRASLRIVLLTGLWLPLGCRPGSERPPAPEPAQGPIQLRDVTAETRITFHHTDGSSGQYYIIEAMSAGLALFDYDGDGLIDIYFLNGAPLKGASVDQTPRNALYRNLGNWQFVDVTEQAGVGDPGFGLGVTVADFNNNGLADLYLNNYGPNVLYRNNGDGTFTDVTAEAGVENGHLVGAGTAFLDINANGNLDLYAANYLDFCYDSHFVRTVNGYPAYPMPRDYQPVPDTLYRNNGDGTFTDISDESGIGRYAGTSMGLICADYNQSGATDVFVMNDVLANFFFQNDGYGNFQEVAIQNGTAFNFYGEANASMGVDSADYNHNGWLDFYMTAYQGEHAVLYRNLGDGILEDATLQANASDGLFTHVNWGIGWVDFDNDGHRDLFIANGHTEDNIELRDSAAAYRARNTLLRNRGDGTFVNESTLSGDGLWPVHASRGAAFDDLDNSGRIDVVVLNSRENPNILRNESSNDHHWLQLRLRGVQANRDAVGSRVIVTAGGLVQTAEVHSGRSYQSHYGSRLHFGLGPRDRVDRLEIRWHGGGEDVFHDLPVNRMLSIVQGSAQVRTLPRPEK